MSAADVSVVVPSWNTRELLLACLAALRGEALREVIVVDNGSSDGSAEAVAEAHPEVRLLRNERNEGFSRACNRGIEAAEGTLVLLLNADTEVRPGAIRDLRDFLAENEEYAACAPRLVDPSGATQKSCMAFPGWSTPLWFGTPLERWFPGSRELARYFLSEFDHETDRDVEQPAAACLLLRRRALDQVGLLDERLWLFFNDVDLCRRLIDAGWKIRFLAGPEVLHHRGASTAQFEELVPEWHGNRLAYYRKHFGVAAGLWVKACVFLAWIDFALAQGFRRLRGKPAEPVQPMTRALGAFLRR